MILPHPKPLHLSTNMVMGKNKEEKKNTIIHTHIHTPHFELLAVNTYKTVKAIRIMLRRDFPP